MVERRFVKNLGWVCGLLLMACSGTRIKDVGDIDAAAGHGGSGATVAQAGTGGGKLVGEGGGGGSTDGPHVTPSCGDCTVDVLGPAEKVEFSDKHASISSNIVDVTSTRVLRKIEATLQITERTSAAWVVYEEVAGAYVLRLDLPTKLDPADGVFDSMPFEFELQAGHRYAIGIYLNVGVCYGSDSPESDELSFGKVAGSSFAGGSDYHNDWDFVSLYGSQFAMNLYTSVAE